MSDNSAIEWTDTTWNPTTGCDKVSPGCDNCYACGLAKRLKGMGSAKYQKDGNPRTSGPGFGLTVHPDTVNDPFTWKKPRKVFVNSMSDLFHDDVPDAFIAEVSETMARTPQHTYQILTKRHGRMRSLLSRPSFRDNALAHGAGWPLPNVWLGVSVEDQKRADLRIPALLDTPAATRFLSCEPLLGPVDLSRWLGVEYMDALEGYGEELGAALTGHVGPSGGLHWVIVGGESGAGARPMHPGWARSLRDQCQAGGVPFHFKQWGAWAPWLSHPEGEDGPGDTFVNLDGDTGHVWFNEDLDRPTNCTTNWGETSFIVSRVGKKHAGRVLDGRTWDEFPQAVTA